MVASPLSSTAPTSRKVGWRLCFLVGCSSCGGCAKTCGSARMHDRRVALHAERDSNPQGLPTQAFTRSSDHHLRERWIEAVHARPCCDGTRRRMELGPHFFCCLEQRRRCRWRGTSAPQNRVLRVRRGRRMQWHGPELLRFAGAVDRRMKVLQRTGFRVAFRHVMQRPENVDAPQINQLTGCQQRARKASTMACGWAA